MVHGWVYKEGLQFKMAFLSALELAFESLYRDDVFLTESQLPSTVAAASMLQLVGGVSSSPSLGFRMSYVTCGVMF